jgi:hypothetical protein
LNKLLVRSLPVSSLAVVYDFWIPEEIWQPRGALYQILQTASSQYTTRPATHFEGVELTFWEIKQRVDPFVPGDEGFGDVGEC